MYKCNAALLFIWASDSTNDIKMSQNRACGRWNNKAWLGTVCHEFSDDVDGLGLGDDGVEPHQSVVVQSLHHVGFFHERFDGHGARLQGLHGHFGCVVVVSWYHTAWKQETGNREYRYRSPEIRLSLFVFVVFLMYQNDTLMNWIRQISSTFSTVLYTTCWGIVENFNLEWRRSVQYASFSFITNKTKGFFDEEIYITSWSRVQSLSR